MAEKDTSQRRPSARRRSVTVDSQLNAPKGLRQLRGNRRSQDRFGRATELVARGMGTPWFLIGLSMVVVGWMTYNSLAPVEFRFDSSESVKRKKTFVSLT